MLAPRRLVVLREFVAQGTIAGAAEALAFTPSAVSQQLAQLQREAGVELFRKAGRRLELTDAGRMLAARAGGVLAALEELEADLARQAGEVRGIVRVASFQTATRALVMPALARLAAAHPALRVELTELEAEESLPLLARGGVDVAIAEEYEHAPRPRLPELHRDDLEADELAAHAPARARGRGRRRRCAWRRCAARRGRPRAPGPNYADMFVRACRIAGGFEPDIHHRVNDIQMLLDLVAISGAAALLPSLGQPAEDPRVAVRPAGRGPFTPRAVRGDARGRSRAARRRPRWSTRWPERVICLKSGGSIKPRRGGAEDEVRRMRVFWTTLLVVAVLAAGPATSRGAAAAGRGRPGARMVDQLPPPVRTRCAGSWTSCRRCPCSRRRCPSSRSPRRCRRPAPTAAAAAPTARATAAPGAAAAAHRAPRGQARARRRGPCRAPAATRRPPRAPPAALRAPPPRPAARAWSRSSGAEATRRAPRRPRAAPDRPRPPSFAAQVDGRCAARSSARCRPRSCGRWRASSAIAIALAINAYWQSRRRVALEAQRAELLDDIGLLSRALLPAMPEGLGGVAVSAAYRPADGPAAGGDFYDVFTLGEERVCVLLGDVSGHGRESVTQAALARYTLRTLLAGRPPAGGGARARRRAARRASCGPTSSP